MSLSEPSTAGGKVEISDAEKAFGEAALAKKAITEDALQRAKRAQSELAILGVEKRLPEVLVALGFLGTPAVRRIERALERREQLRLARRFGQVIVKNKLASKVAVEEALAELRASRGTRTFADVLVARSVLRAPSVAAIERTLAKKRRAARKAPETARIDRNELAGAAKEDLARADVGLAAVALREGLVGLDELDWALGTCRRAGTRSLASVLLERGLITERELPGLEASVAAGLRGQLKIPGYTVLDLLGQGATSLVVRARHDLIGREVAIKLIPGGNPAENVDLIEEIRRAARVRHPNVVFLQEVGRLPRRIYLVLELLDGPTLMDEIRRRSPLPERDVLRWTRDLCRALEALEEAGLVHRDLKPHNVVLEGEGARAKLTDLGLARPTGWRFDRPGVIAGTPHTISPEQARGESVDIRSDLYSLGATAYYALVGRPPYDADSALDIVLRHLHDPVPDVRALRGDVSSETAALVASLMAKTADERPDGPRLVAERLDGLLGRTGLDGHR